MKNVGSQLKMLAKSPWVLALVLAICLISCGNAYIKTKKLERQSELREALSSRIDSLNKVNASLRASHVTDSVMIANQKRQLYINRQNEKSKIASQEFLLDSDSFLAIPYRSKVLELARLIAESDSAAWSYIHSSASD